MSDDIRTMRSSRCVNCGYSLFGIGSDRCPECGLPFDPYPSRRTFKTGPGTVPGWIVVLVGFLLLILIGFVFVPLFVSWFGA